MSNIDSGQLELEIAGKKDQQERFWYDDEKHAICEQAVVQGGDR